VEGGKEDMNKLRMRRAAEVILALLLVCVVADVTPGYSVLSHEAVIDSTWDKDIRPLLLRRFPSASADELREAHAHAYGGAIIQDMGYYPFGSKFFSDLTHYVRSGEFVRWAPHCNKPFRPDSVPKTAPAVRE